MEGNVCILKFLDYDSGNTAHPGSGDIAESKDGSPLSEREAGSFLPGQDTQSLLDQRINQFFHAFRYPFHWWIGVFLSPLGDRYLSRMTNYYSDQIRLAMKRMNPPKSM